MFIFTLLIGTLLLSGCGRNEATGGVLGAGTGAALGAIAGGRHAGVGAAIGALGGYVLGSSVGRSADDDEQVEIQERKERMHLQRQAALERENERLRESTRKYCNNCNKQSMLKNANSCSHCGGKLIYERICPKCAEKFEPQSGYRYCPYCPPGTQLSAR